MKWTLRRFMLISFSFEILSGLLIGCTGSVSKLNRAAITTGQPLNLPSAAAKDTILISLATIATPPAAAGANAGAPAGANAGAGTAAAGPVTSLFFNSAQSSVPITNHCNLVANPGAGATSKPCNCQFTWTSSVSSTTSSSSSGGLTPGATISHTVVQPLITIQPTTAACNAPSLFGTEISNGTQINISIVPGNNNPDTGTFTVPAFPYVVGQTTASGSFADSEGHAFDNILHYSCYGLFQRGMSIQSKTTSYTQQTSSFNLQNVMIGTQFCVNSINGTGGDGTSCPNLGASTYSRQNYYYSLYVGSSESGSINGFNSSFYCPLVIEALGNNGTVGTQAKPYPLDSTFALSLGPSTTFSVGVEGNSQVNISGDASSANTACSTVSAAGIASPVPAQAGGGAAPGTGFVQSCLGYATPPNPDGTCSTVKNASNQIVQTFRLRKYIALYPRVFDTTGTPISQAQAIDTIYVLDRPVYAKSPLAGGSSALPLYTMLGPKPCPFAYFDNLGTAQANPNNPYPLPSPGSTPLASYVASNSSHWVGKNIDGIEFPNQDIPKLSCSTTFPILTAANQFSMSTVNLYNQTQQGTLGQPSAFGNQGSGLQHVYVRPTQPFLPHYEEDTTFLACAPQATPFIDPPLHFSKDPISGNVAWCAESYPSQNNNIVILDPPITTYASGKTPTATGNIPNYTSHIVKNTLSPNCSATIPNLGYQAGSYCYPPGPNGSNCALVTTRSYASHPATLSSNSTYSWAYDAGDGNHSTSASATCDRTAVAGTQWAKFPLIAPAADIENSLYGIQTDKSYHCLMTYDQNNGKTGISSPSSGCCDGTKVYVTSGISTTPGAVATPTAAHLEPGVPCSIPTY